MVSDFETVIAKCDGCKYEEECREMPPCILDAYNKGGVDAIEKVFEVADCSHTDCWDCAFADADLCKLQMLYKEYKY